ncbi:hypothetical protein BGZ51_003124 [Haplosporangium sp. Z 767]|nr:hypothetical protein BGZ51_003124 [Haplosporangium sp. Z 767]KAF9191433.1 hypothetical protein BGZ50_009387 [Haplosporangium sp. Z 11]
MAVKKRQRQANTSRNNIKSTETEYIQIHSNSNSRSRTKRSLASALFWDINTPFNAWATFLGFILLLAFVAYRGHYQLPAPVTEGINPITGQTQFSEANVRELTAHLSEDIGLRLIGTEQVEETEKYLIKEIKAFKDQSKIKAARGTVGLPNFDMWIQVDDGSHRFDFMSKVVMKMYTNMTNIIVRLSCGPECDENSILLNAHYDTTLGSPGAADDALGVGVLMELIRILSQRPALKKNSIVFLFNGGEETLQDASHSFITNHELKDKVKAVINLEGCGTTGPEILFQANSRPMIDAYKKVPYPHGTVLANDMFATGLILSDTDFRQFVEYGNLTGLDMAVYKNSYLYHTHLDLNEHLEPGLPQHMGENTLALVTHLGNEVDLSSGFNRTSEVVFFDVLGLFFVSYSLASAIKLHIVVGVIALIALLMGASRPSFKPVLSVVLSLFVAIIAPNFGAAMLLSAGKPMQWFTHEWLPFLLFGPFSVAGMLLVQYMFHDDTISSAANELSTFSGIQFVFAVVMSTATYAGLASSYIVALYSISFTLALIYNQRRASAQTQDGYNVVIGIDYSTYFIASVVPTTYFLQSAYSLIDVVVPLTGRIGARAAVEYIITGMVGLVVFFTCPPILAFSHRFGSRALKKVIALLVILQVAIVLISIDLFEPYNKLHPKRVFAQHLRNLTSGETQIYVAHADPGPIYDNYVTGLESMFNTTATYRKGSENPSDWSSIYPFSQFLDSYVLDTTPYIRSQTINETIATSTAPLTELIKDAPKLVAEKVSYDQDTGLRRLTILCTHSEYILTVVSFDAQLTQWSLASAIPSADRFHYVIRNAGGYRTNGWMLELEYRASGPEDRLRIEITSMETEGFDWRADEERELEGSGDIGVMRKLAKSKPDFVALTYFSTVASTFYL